MGMDGDSEGHFKQDNRKWRMIERKDVRTEQKGVPPPFLFGGIS